MRIIQGGSHEFNSLIYGNQHQGTLAYLKNQISGFMQSGMQTLTDAGKSFMQGVGSMFEQFNGSEAMRRARAVYRKVENLFTIDIVREMRDLGDIQSAMPVMQRFIMAQPDVRQAYLDQRICGYAGQYENIHGNDIKHDHYDYRFIMDGVVTEAEDGGDKITYYFDDTEGDIDLPIADRADVLNAWDMIQGFMKIGKEDPTSPWGALM